MNVRELAIYLRLSEAKVYRMANSGSVPAFRVGRSWRFKKDMIDDWIQRQVRTASALDGATPESRTLIEGTA
jgi:excisionase family DNA binding protein